DNGRHIALEMRAHVYRRLACKTFLAQAAEGGASTSSSGIPGCGPSIAASGQLRGLEAACGGWPAWPALTRPYASGPGKPDMGLPDEASLPTVAVGHVFPAFATFPAVTTTIITTTTITMAAITSKVRRRITDMREGTQWLERLQPTIPTSTTIPTIPTSTTITPITSITTITSPPIMARDTIPLHLSSMHGHDGAQGQAAAHQQAARQALADPLSRLMASRGMPLGLSFTDQHKSDEVCEEEVGGQGQAEPSYRMEAIEELSNLLMAALAAKTYRAAGAAAAAVLVRAQGQGAQLV
ncbi:hypothetical protein QJQ45_030279, partial [Haematococcus lacustris]